MLGVIDRLLLYLSGGCVGRKLLRSVDKDFRRGLGSLDFAHVMGHGNVYRVPVTSKMIALSKREFATMRFSELEINRII